MYGGNTIQHPPILPHPGTNSQRDADAFGIQWPAHPLPGYVGHTFTFLCKLWSIVQDILSLYNVPSSKPIAERVPLSFAEQKYQEMLFWADTFTSELAQNPHHQLHVDIFQSVISPPFPLPIVH